MFVRWCLVCSLVLSSTASAEPLPRGVWQSAGYGYIVDVGSKVRRYDVSPAGCVRADSLTRSQFEVHGGRAVRDGSDLVLWRGATQDRLRRLDKLPDACGRPLRGDDPALNLEVFVATLDALYPFFDQRGGQWPTALSQARQRAPTDLSGAIGALIESLDDGHVGLFFDNQAIAIDRVVAPGNAPDGAPWEWRSLRRDFSEFLQSKQAGLQAPPELIANRRLMLGRFDDGTAYLGVLAMGGWGDGEDESLPADTHAATADAVLDPVLAAIADAPGLVLDLRLNPGGYDAVAMALVARFADQPRVAFTRQAQRDAGPPYEVRIAPSQRRGYAGKVAVLIGPNTVSAAEVAAIALAALPQARLFGRPTRGTLSDAIPKRLPNGWEFTLSVETLRAPDGTLLEVEGVQPDQPVDPPTEANRLWQTEIEIARRWLSSPDDTAAS
jgi:hypothetical protein